MILEILDKLRRLWLRRCLPPVVWQVYGAVRYITIPNLYHDCCPLCGLSLTSQLARFQSVPTIAQNPNIGLVECDRCCCRFEPEDFEPEDQHDAEMGRRIS